MLEDLCWERRVVLLLPMSEGLGTLGDWANVLAFFKKAFFALGDLVFFLIFFTALRFPQVYPSCWLSLPTKPKGLTLDGIVKCK